MIQVKISDIVKNLAKDSKFLQPMFEAIINSLEANATEINIEISSANSLPDIPGSITGFTITDNGDGFNEKNLEAFGLLWTDNKIELGCKGSGRFTWLSVFEEVKIHSFVKNENMEVVIPFNMDFSTKKIELIKNFNIEENKTVISFNTVTNRFYSNEGGKVKDTRLPADALKIKDLIMDYLLVTLFLLKKENRPFRINISTPFRNEIIDNDSIVDLELITFTMKNIFRENEFFEFNLYYHFMDDKKNSKKIYYCSNKRAIKEKSRDILDSSYDLPDSNSFVMLLCSEYFDSKDNDSRDELIELSNLKSPTIFCPLLLTEINAKVKETVFDIIIKKYPQLSQINDQAVEDAIIESPHLTTFIKKNNEIIKSKKSLLASANKEFNEAKIRVINKFKTILEDKSIDPETFTTAVKDISMIAAAELGEYILYRNNIITALKKSLNDEMLKESFFHDIFMTMKTSSNNNNGSYLLNNLWLLDDKFMGYSYAASDKTFKQIMEEIEEKNETKYKLKNRPDLAIFYNKECGTKDIIMVEFKGVNAKLDEKNKSLNELPANINILKKNIGDVATTWGYIITSIDEDFKTTIKIDGRFKELFSSDNNDDNKIYYAYLENLNAHIYITDLSLIVADSEARNKTFLDILMKSGEEA